MGSKFESIVIGNRFYTSFGFQKRSFDALCHDLGRFFLDLEGHRKSALAFDKSNDSPFMIFSNNRICFPMAGFLASIDFFWPKADINASGDEAGGSSLRSSKSPFSLTIASQSQIQYSAFFFILKDKTIDRFPTDPPSSYFSRSFRNLIWT